jgi:diguanylate cyclase (GGDEF)-like protein/PAS domain S-box-containing protein
VSSPLHSALKIWRPHILVACALAVILMSGLDATLRHLLTDYRFRWTERPASGEIVMVAIDPYSLEQVGVWPWSRYLYAGVIRQLQRAGARDVVLDIDFSAPSEPSADAALRDALKEAGGSVVLPLFRQPGRDAHGALLTHVNRPLAQFADNAWSALVNVPVDADGRVRSYPRAALIDGEVLPAMATILAGRQDSSVAQFLIDFGIRRDTVPTVSFVDVLHGKPEALARLRDKRVIVGGTALELGDRFAVPNGVLMPGPLLQAIAAESLLQQRDLRLTSGWLTLIAIAALFGAMIAMWRRPAGYRVAGLIGGAVVLEGVALALQARLPVVLDTALPLAAVAFYLVAVALDEIDLRTLLSSVAERRFQRVAMSLGDGLVCADHRERVTLWNDAAAEIFGYRADEIVGQPFQTLLADPASLALSEFRDPRSDGRIVRREGRRRNGEVFPLELSLASWQGADAIQYGVLARDVSVREAEAARIRYLAEYDTVTGLPNRTTFHAQVGALVASYQGGRTFSLLIVGINGFQEINDMLGYAAGDLLLKAAGERIRSAAPPGSVVARLGGNEFAVLLRDDRDPGRVGESIARAFEAPLDDARADRLRVSIGTASYPADGQSADELLGAGHLAQGRAKADKHRGVVSFEPAYREELEARLTLESELTLAADRDEFELFYQPQVRLADGAIVGAEALIRWRHPTRGLVPPGAFIPVVNTSPISERVANWVLLTACRQARDWELAGKPVRVGVNLSPSQVLSGSLAANVRAALALTRLSPCWLELEVTEDIILADADKARAMFREIQELGVRLVFDDFGTGYASLTYLKQFPLDGLKIDRSFVAELTPGSGDAAIVSSTIELSQKLGLDVIAEGIEDDATARLLIAMGCHEGQGYFFGRPTPAAEFEAKFLARVVDVAPAAAGHRLVDVA